MRLVPLADFFRNPERASMRVSPGGNHIAYLAPWKNRLNVHVRPFEGGDDIRLSEVTERDIPVCGWANDRCVLYVRDTGGDENFHAYAVDIHERVERRLTPFDGVKVTVEDILEDDDEHVLISMNRRDPQLFDVYRLNVTTAELTLVAENPGGVVSWMTDDAGRLRVGIQTDGVSTALLYRPDDSAEFREIVRTDFKDSILPVAFGFDDRSLIVSSNLGRDTKAIYEFDPEAAELGRLVFEHPEVDVEHVLRSKVRRVLTGVWYVTDRLHHQFFDDERAALQRRIDDALPGADVHVVSMSVDETRRILRSSSDRSRGTYYTLDDREDANEAPRKVVDVAPWLNPDELCEMTAIAYDARDGRRIHGYLTLPQEVERPVPVVVNPHGGPWARDSWGFGADVQFLANRGYAVLQVNFRGSTGYGRAFWQAGFRQWGRAMQDDITDGVNWLVSQGIADPNRIGIYGASYGGYAVLAGLTFTPDLYACGVDYVGVSNIFTLLETLPPYWEPMREMMYEMVGHPEKDADHLREVSPVFHADAIRSPLLVAQGANDPRVKQSESDQIVAALRARGVEVQYIVKEDEGHGFQNEENRFELYHEIERFLGAHLGGRVAE